MSGSSCSAFRLATGEDKTYTDNKNAEHDWSDYDDEQARWMRVDPGANTIAANHRLQRVCKPNKDTYDTGNGADQLLRRIQDSCHACEALKEVAPSRWAIFT
jgi:hypothetical protein